jgi:sulfur relay (sulfurtransferase) complex TusBCD TusD component (DsrE family)
MKSHSDFIEGGIAMANFLFVLSQDDNEKATRCFQFAKIAVEKGHKVDVFFIDSGVLWADNTRDMNVKTETGDCPNDYLPALVEKEVPIGV